MDSAASLAMRGKGNGSEDQMAVSLSGIVMQYPGTRALDDVSVDFRFDEVHGLIGENGAGKTTLVSVLAGSKLPTAGKITIDGRQAVLHSAGDALRKGIAHVSQEGCLVPGLSAAQNILLGDEPRNALGIINKRELSSRAAALLEKWFPEVSIDLDMTIDSLPMADQKVIEIVRALRGDIRLLILDEPTATLPAREKENLWRIIKTLPARGVGIVLISHFLSEVKALSDRITVLRDGRHVSTLASVEASEAQLVDLMLQRAGGAGTGTAAAQVTRTIGDAVLELEEWEGGRCRSRPLRDPVRGNCRPDRSYRRRPFRFCPVDLHRGRRGPRRDAVQRSVTEERQRPRHAEARRRLHPRSAHGKRARRGLGCA
ncbi:ABC-type sugar transport system ATPase subunit [Sinorhizobium medicae]